MTTFMKIDRDGNLVTVRELPQEAMLNCPHCIMVPEHYREDNSCKCNDPKESIMEEWGYVWDHSRLQWIGED